CDIYFCASCRHRRHPLYVPTRRSSDLPRQQTTQPNDIDTDAEADTAAEDKGLFDTARDKAAAIGNSAADMGTRAWDKTSDTATSDRKSTRLNSSHVSISYAVFCLKKQT